MLISGFPFKPIIQFLIYTQYHPKNNIKWLLMCCLGCFNEVSAISLVKRLRNDLMKNLLLLPLPLGDKQSRSSLSDWNN